MSAALSIETPFHYDAPLFKADEARQLIWARAAAEEPDKSGEILDYASAVPEFKKWSASYHAVTKGRSLGNIRAMHNHRHIAGKVESIAYDDAGRAIDVCVKVLDPVDWAKVQSGGYTGLSIGGGYLRKWADPDNGKLTRYTPKIMEISLVDSPCIPSARILEMTKRDGTVNEIPLTGQPRTFGQMREPRTFNEMSKINPYHAALTGALLGSGDLNKAGPVFAGAVGGVAGASAGLLATRGRSKGETAQRQGKRIRNNLLIGGALGTGAGYGLHRRSARRIHDAANPMPKASAFRGGKAPVEGLNFVAAPRGRIIRLLRGFRRSEEAGDLNKAYTDTWSATEMGTGDTRLGGTEARSLGGYTTGPYRGSPVARWLHSDGSVVEGDQGVLKRVKLKIGREGHVVPVVADEDGVILKRAPEGVAGGSPRRAAMALALTKATRLGKGNDIAFTTALAGHIQMKAVEDPGLEKFSGRALALGGGGALAGGLIGGVLAGGIGLHPGAGALVGSIYGGSKGLEAHNRLTERDKKNAADAYYSNRAIARGNLSPKQHQQRINAAKRRWKKEGQSELPDAFPHKGILARVGRAPISDEIAQRHQLHDVHDAMDAYDKVRPHIPEDAKVMIGIHEHMRPDRHLLYNPEGAGLEDFDDLGRPTRDIVMLHPHEVDDFIAEHGSNKVKKSDAPLPGLIEHISQIPGA